jgi:DNA-binding IclR family transcriptional regulator
MASASGSYAAPALERGLDVLELLCERGQTSTLSEIAAALGLSRNQIFRVVHILEARGYLLREGDRYAASNRMFQLAARHPPFATLIEVATPEMRTLAATIGQSCHITIPVGTRTVVIARIENPNAISIALPLGHNLPIHETASGRAILAMLPPEECDKLIARLEPRAERQLRVGLARIRARGYEISPGVRTLGVVDLSFPIFEATSRPVGCLGVPLLRKRPADMPIERLLALSRAAAGRISNALATLRLRIGRRPDR